MIVILTWLVENLGGHVEFTANGGMRGPNWKIYQITKVDIDDTRDLRYRIPYLTTLIEFDSDTDATLFKLRWME